MKLDRFAKLYGVGVWHAFTREFVPTGELPEWINHMPATDAWSYTTVAGEIIQIDGARFEAFVENFENSLTEFERLMCL